MPKLWHMIIDIFSSFDPLIFQSIPILPTSSILTFSASLILISAISASYWSKPSWNSQLISLPIKYAHLQFNRTPIKDLSSILTRLFFTLILINLIGILPYTFAVSTHLFFSLTFGLNLWLSLLISGFCLNLKEATGSLLPSGAPLWLASPLVFIETIRIIIRPITLSFRLSANMRAGHVILCLIRSYGAAAFFASFTASLTLIFISLIYIIFELVICIIQAYVFYLLLSIYMEDLH